MSQKPYAVHVLPCRSLVVSGVNLQEEDRFVVHRVVDSECDIKDAVDIPFSPNGSVVAISYTTNPINLTMPGRYRIYPDGVVSDTAYLYIDEIKGC